MLYPFSCPLYIFLLFLFPKAGKKLIKKHRRKWDIQFKPNVRI